MRNILLTVWADSHFLIHKVYPFLNGALKELTWGVCICDFGSHAYAFQWYSVSFLVATV